VWLTSRTLLHWHWSSNYQIVITFHTCHSCLLWLP
jgi:hypothetical protein